MFLSPNKFELIKAISLNPQIVKVKPLLNWFLLQYLRKFKVMNVGGHFIVHPHLPPINSTAYSRFIDEHLLAKSTRPTHAQIGLTNVCPQNCEYCYNKNKAGKVMDTATIK